MFGLYAQDEETTTALFYAPLQLAPEQSAKSQAVENEKEQVRESAQAEQGSAPSPSSVPTAKIDLNHMLVSHPGETFYCRVNGDSMSGAGIFDGDILIVDRHATPRHGDVVLAILNNELSCRTLDMHNQVLRAANPEFQELPIEKGSDFDIKGVVISSIRLHRECEG